MFARQQTQNRHRIVALLICATLVLSNSEAALATQPATNSGQAQFQGSSKLVTLEFPLELSELASDPIEAAAQHIAQHPDQLGIQGLEFVPIGLVPSIGGISTVRFRQQLRGTQVAGSLLALTVDQQGALLSYSVRTSSAPTSAGLTMSSTEAAAVAKRSLLDVTEIPNQAWDVVDVEQLVADSNMFAALSDGSHFVWRVRLINGADGYEVYVADENSKILSSTQVKEQAVGDVAPLVCNWTKSTTSPGILDLSRSPNILCSEDKSQVSDGSDIIAAGERARLETALQVTSNFFATNLNIDIRDEHYLGNISPQINYSGVTEPSARAACTENADTENELPITTESCTPRISVFYDYCIDVRENNSELWSCPNYPNAFWNPWHDNVDSVEGANCRSKYCSGLYFGRGFAADDVVAHELSHGVIGGEAFLNVPNIETDALSEVFADIFGESVDQLDVKAGEVADKNWNFGEDVGYTSAGAAISGVVRGPFRTMRRSDAYEKATIGSGWDLSGEPHENLGPGVRFAWLIANGGKQGKTSISAIGTTPWGSGNDGLCQTTAECTGVVKLAQLSMNALPKLWGASSYYDFGRSMLASCNDFVVAGVGDFTKSNCTQVRKALVATNILKIKIKPMNKLTKVKKGSTRTLKARILTSTGIGAANIPVKLQQWKRGRWVTIQTSNTNLQGYGRFPVTFKKSATYRIITVKSVQVPKLISPKRRVTVS